MREFDVSSPQGELLSLLGVIAFVEINLCTAHAIAGGAVPFGNVL